MGYGTAVHGAMEVGGRMAAAAGGSDVWGLLLAMRVSEGAGWTGIADQL